MILRICRLCFANTLSVVTSVVTPTLLLDDLRIWNNNGHSASTLVLSEFAFSHSSAWNKRSL